MATVTITGPAIREAGAKPDNRPWKLRAAAYQDGGSGSVITPGADYQLLRPVAGRLAFPVEAGVDCYLENPDGKRYLVTIPDEDSGLWEVIEAGVAFPPDTSQAQLSAALSQYLQQFFGQFVTVELTEDDEIQMFWDGEPVGDPFPPQTAAWNALLGKPTVVASGSTQAAARDSIEAARNKFVRPARVASDTNGIDDTSAIQTLLGEGANEVVFRKGLEWTIDAEAMLTPVSNTRIIIEEGAVLKVKPTAAGLYRLFQVSNVQNVTIEGMGTLLGDAPDHLGATGEYGHLINITNGASNIQVLGPLLLKQSWGDAIYIGGTAKCFDVLVDGVTIEDCRREGIAPFWVDGCTIRHCRILNIGSSEITSPGSGIDCEPNSGEDVNHLTIENNYIEGAGGCGIYVSSNPGPVAELIIRDNEVVDCGLTETNLATAYQHNGIHVALVDRPVLFNNIVRGSGYDGVVNGTSGNIYIRSCDYATIKGGELSEGLGPGLLITASTNPEVSNVTIRDNQYHGAYLWNTSGAVLRGNHFIDNVQNADATVEHLIIHTSGTGDNNAVLGNVFRGSNGHSWVRPRAAAVDDTIIAGNIGIGTAPANGAVSDSGTNTVVTGNFRKAAGVYENWSTADRVPVGTLELGHASDTTVARTAAGRAAIEGAEIITSTAVAAVAAKATPVDADLLPLFDSAASNALKQLSIANLKALLYAYIVGAAPATMDTLDEIAAALADDANFAATMTAALANKVDKTASVSRLYGTDGAGLQTTRVLDAAATASTVPFRGAGGVLKVGTAAANEDAVPKAQLDARILAPITGSPEGVVTAPVGSIVTRADGGANTTLYVKESGSGNTGWVAK